MDLGRAFRWAAFVACILVLAVLVGLAYAGGLIMLDGDRSQTRAHVTSGPVLAPVFLVTPLAFALTARRRYRRRWSNLSNQQHNTAARALWRGPIPDQVPVLEEAIRRGRSLRGLDGDHPWLPAAVTGAITVAAAIAASLIDSWLWPWVAIAALLTGQFALVGLVVRPRLRLMQAALAERSATTASAHDDTVPSREATTAIQLVTPRPPLWAGREAELLCDVDSSPRHAVWNHTWIPVEPGRHRIHISVDAPFAAAAQASTEIDIADGQQIRLYYSPAWIARMHGRLGTDLQPRPGLWALIVITTLMIVALLALWFVLFS